MFSLAIQGVLIEYQLNWMDVILSMGTTKKICTFLTVEYFSQSYYGKGHNYSETYTNYINFFKQMIPKTIIDSILESDVGLPGHIF